MGSAASLLEIRNNETGATGGEDGGADVSNTMRQS